MASVFDALIAQLLHDVALAGPRGLRATDFEKSIQRFCDEHNQKSRDHAEHQPSQDLLFSNSPPFENIFVDDDLIDSAFEWLCKNSEVLIRDQPEAVTPNSSAKSNAGSTLTKLGQKLSNKIIRAPEERIWLELTGHGVDHTRIATLDFECLLAIAASGPNGVLQKYIVERTGQDKRSVPARTDRLAQGGYIVKESVVGEGARTSLCTLTKYKKKLQSNNEVRPTATQRKPVSSGATIFYDVWFDTFIQILKQNKGSTTLDVARTELGIDASVGERRRFFQCVRRLVESGCLRIMKGKVQRPNPDGHWGVSRYKRVQCVQLVREPTQEDREFFKKADQRANRTSMAMQTGDKFDEDNAFGDSDDDPDAINAFDGDTAQNSVDVASMHGAVDYKPSSHWTPVLPLHNQVLNLIKGAGRQGLTARQLFEQLAGPLWTRPLDEVLARLTDVWHHSQPPHLRHLSMIRDTAMHGKMSVFHYRTFDRYREAVEAGEAVWDAILGTAGKKGAEEKRRALDKKADLDEWGFPKIDPKAIHGDGRATLSQCKKGAIKYSSHDLNKSMINHQDDCLSDDLDNDDESAGHSEDERCDVTPKARKVPKAKSAAKERSAKKQTSYEEQVLREPGVYIDPSWARALKRKLQPITGRPRKSMILVIVMPRLQDLSWWPNKVSTAQNTDDQVHRASSTLAVAVNHDSLAETSSTAHNAYHKQGTSGFSENNSTPVSALEESVSIERSAPGAKSVGESYTSITPETADSQQTRHSRCRTGVSTEPNQDSDAMELRTPSSVFKNLEVPQITPGHRMVATDDTPGPVKDTSNGLRSTIIDYCTDAVLRAAEPTTIEILQAELKALKKPGRRSNATKAAMCKLEEQIANMMSSRDENSAGKEPHVPKRRRPNPITDDTHSHDDRDLEGRAAVNVEDTGLSEDPHSSTDLPIEKSSARHKMTASQTPSISRISKDMPQISSSSADSPVAEASKQDAQAEYEFHDERPTAFTDDGRPRRGRRAGATRQGGSISTQRNKIILEAVHACGGVFPGNHEMCYVVMTAWQRRYQLSPDKQTVDRAVRNLLATARLKKITWTFADQRGFVHTRAVLTEPHIRPHDQIVKELQRRIEASLPVPYLPNEVDVLDTIRQQVAYTYGSKIQDELQENGEGNGGRGDGVPSYPEEDLLVQQTSLMVQHAQARKDGIQDGLDEAVYKATLDRYTHSFALDKSHSVNAAVEVDAPLEEDSDERTARSGEQESHGPQSEPAQDAFLSFKVPGYHHDASHAMRPDQIAPGMSERLARPFATNLGPRIRPLTSSNQVQSVPTKVRQWRWYEKRVTHPLNAGGDQWARARLLFHGTKHAFFAESGVFATRPYVPDTAQIEIRALQKEYFAAHPSPALGPPSAPHRARIVPVPVARERVLRSSRKIGTIMKEIASRHLQPAAEDLADDDIVPEESLQELYGGSTPADHDVDNPGTSARRKFNKRKRPSNRDEVEEWSGADDQDASDYKPPKRKRKYKTRIRKEKPAPLEKTASDKSRIHPPNKSGRRDRATAAAFKDTDRLVTAVALVSAICGGTNQDRLSWTLISHALGFRYDGEFLRRRWQWPSRHRKADVDQLRDAIRDPFLRAYERGQLPRIDFHNLAQTDWPSLFKWVETRVIPTLKASKRGSDVPDLLNDRTKFDREFVLDTQRSSSEVKKSAFFTSLTLEHRRHMAVAFLNSSPLDYRPGQSTEGEASDILLRSWIRAVAMTKQNKYDATAAGAKLGIFESLTLETTIQEMLSARTLIQDKKGRHLPGRNFQIHSDCLQQFRRWPKQDEHVFLRMVAEARTSINDHFRYYDVLELVPTAQDTEYLVLANLVSQGFLAPIVTLPERNDDQEAPHPKLTMWSYGGYNYETKTANINSLKHPVAYMRLPTYQFEHKLRHVPIPLMPPPFAGEAEQRIPIWIDIHGNFIEDVWDMVLRSVLHCLVYRTGLKSESIEQAHAEKILQWEIDILLDWMEKSGLAEHCGTGIYDSQTNIWRGGWRASEWWYCAFLPEISNWSVPQTESADAPLLPH